MKTLLGEIASFGSGGTPARSIPEYFEGDIPWITGADIGDQFEITPRSHITATAVAESAVQLVDPGTLLLVTRTSVGKVSMADRILGFSQDITSIDPDKSRAEPKYLLRFLEYHGPRLAHQSRGATIKGVTRKEVGAIPIPLPPLPEQRRIAAILDRADILRVARHNSMKLVSRMAHSFFERVIVASEDATFLPLSALGDWRAGGTPSRARTDYFRGSIPWVSSGELGQLHISTTKESISHDAVRETSAKMVPCGSLLLGMYDTAALKSSIAAIEMSCNQAVAFSPLSTLVIPEYLHFAIQRQRASILSLRRGIRQKNLNLSMIRDVRVPVPPVEQQKRFKSALAQLESMRSTQVEHLAKLDELFASLQHRAFNGEL